MHLSLVRDDDGLSSLRHAGPTSHVQHHESGLIGLRCIMQCYIIKLRSVSKSRSSRDVCLASQFPVCAAWLGRLPPLHLINGAKFGPLQRKRLTGGIALLRYLSRPSLITGEKRIPQCSVYVYPATGCFQTKSQLIDLAHYESYCSDGLLWLGCAFLCHSWSQLQVYLISTVQRNT